jgi:lantibiotic biosynthesis protein
MAESPAWTPILEGDDAAAAWEVIRAVAKDLADGRGLPSHPADRALYWAYTAGAIDEEWTNTQYDAATELVCESVANGYGWGGLFGGASGAGFTLAHISDAGAADEILGLIDAALERHLEAERWNADYDLIGGLVGYGVYFLERMTASPTETARRCLVRVVDHLVANARSTDPGDGELTWHTPPELLPDHQRAMSPGGYFNCGLAHGVPGVIALLGRIADAGYDPRARDVCERGLRWLANQTLDHPKNSMVAWIDRDRPERSPARTAWCYGDAGATIAAFGAATRIGAPAERWHELAAVAASRPDELCGVNDAGMCHGSVGLAHIANRLYQATGDTRFRDGARRWFKRTLAFRGDAGVGGFRAWTTRTVATALAWEEETSLIEGSAGVALALMAAVQPVEPAWDRMFQCDLPVGTKR